LFVSAKTKLSQDLTTSEILTQLYQSVLTNKMSTMKPFLPIMQRSLAWELSEGKLRLIKREDVICSWALVGWKWLEDGLIVKFSQPSFLEGSSIVSLVFVFNCSIYYTSNTTTNSSHYVCISTILSYVMMGRWEGGSIKCLHHAFLQIHNSGRGMHEPSNHYKKC
jgi:hypothetical protein